jgi:(p)ppGpp synthase/HD superfamily hydrolase
MVRCLMTDIWTVDRAIAFSRFAHLGQVDKAGLDYFEAHVKDVYHRVRRDGGSEAQQIVALLHDAVEDWKDGDSRVEMLSSLAALGLPGPILVSVGTINKPKWMSKSEYYLAVRSDPDALFVKERDIDSNMSRLGYLSVEDRDRLTNKYIRARQELGIK